MNVGSICSRRIVSAPVSAPLSDVAALMRQERVGMVIVTHTVGGEPLVSGVITDRDIVRAQLERTADFAALSTAEIMTRDPLLLHEDDDIEHALQKMRAYSVRRAPVLDARGSLVGVLSVDDLLTHVAREITGLATVIARQGGQSVEGPLF
jgi:CBS domain-containing protein